MQAITRINRQGQDPALERFVVVLTDGTHEAGDEANLRGQLMAKDSALAAIYTVAISGELDADSPPGARQPTR